MNTFSQLDSQSIESRMAQVASNESNIDNPAPLDADKLPPYYCPVCQEYKWHTNPHKTGYHCYDCECGLKLVNSCFEPPTTHTMDVDFQAEKAWLYAIGITSNP